MITCAIARVAGAALIAGAMLANVTPISAQARSPIEWKRHLLPMPVTPVPAGYGHYSSITYKEALVGGCFGSLPSADSDPCGDLLKQNPEAPFNAPACEHPRREQCFGPLRRRLAHLSRPWQSTD